MTDKQIFELFILWLQIPTIELQPMSCGHMCGYHDEYGFVPEEGCPEHDIPTV